MSGRNLAKLLGIKYPFIQGGMARIATGEFASAVSNAGGLGLIGSGAMNKEKLLKEIEICKSLTDKPFGVNLMLLNPHKEDLVNAIIEMQVPVVTTGAGNPGKYIERFHEHGIKVIPVVALPAQAERLNRYHVDAIICEGSEAGGHIGELTTMCLVPQVRNVVDIPVIAAGGIGSASAMSAVMELGADGVQVGTILLATKECPIHQNYKERILKAKSSEITVVGRINGFPTRLLKNEKSRAYLEKENSGASAEELEIFSLGRLKEAVLGDIQNGALMAGQIVGMVNTEKSVKELIEALFKDLETIRGARKINWELNNEW